VGKSNKYAHWLWEGEETLGLRMRIKETKDSEGEGTLSSQLTEKFDKGKKIDGEKSSMEGGIKSWPSRGMLNPFLLRV